MIAACAALLAAVLLAGCGGSAAKVTTSDMQTQIQTGYQQQLEKLARSYSIAAPRVTHVDCVEHGHTGTCIAAVTGSLTGQQSITVDIGDNGRYIWQTTSGSNLKPAAP
jgi:sugar/nucleoside kinase (ribokinase family)